MRRYRFVFGLASLTDQLEKRRIRSIFHGLPLCALLGVLWLSGCAIRGDGNLVRVDASDLIGNGEARYRLAMHAYQKGELEKARRGLEQVVRSNPRHAQAHNNLGLIYYDLRRLSTAAEHFDFASQLLPSSPIPLNNLGMTLEAGGYVNEAMELYSEAHSIAPEHPLYLGNLIRARIRLGEHTPELIEDLKFLAFIENRPDWITWIDEQLALDFNPVLDRGPSVNENPLGSERPDRSEDFNESSPLTAPVLTPEELELVPAETNGILQLESPYAPEQPGEIWEQLQNELPTPAPGS